MKHKIIVGESLLLFHFIGNNEQEVLKYKKNTGFALDFIYSFFKYKNYYSKRTSKEENNKYT